MTRARLEAGVLAAIITGLGAHVARFIARPWGEKLSFMPDDAFYYFQLGREHARSGQWSFDRGQTLTSGFHLLHGWLASVVERVGSLDVRLSLYAALGALLTADALFALYLVAGRLWPNGRLAALLFAGAAGGTFILPLQAMEWPLAVGAASLALFALSTERRALFVVAMLVGPLCRTDFVLVAGALFLAAVLDVEQRRKVLPGVLASGAGAVVVALHAYALNGHFVQTSARTKAFWGSVTGYHPLYGLEPSSYAFGPSLLLTRTLDLGPALLLGPLAVLAVGAFWLRRELAAAPPLARLVTRWSGIVIVILPLAYGRIGAAALCWYSALFVVPFFVVTAALASALVQRRPPALAILGVVGGVVAIVNVVDARRPIWPAGTFGEELTKLAADTSSPRLGAWNAGRIGYLGGERAINLDGLVNDDIYPYLVADRAHCYLVHERIPLIVDSHAWLDLHARMLGASNGRLSAALHRRSVADSRLEAWDVDLGQLAGDAACNDDLRPSRSKSARPYQLPRLPSGSTP